MSVSVLTLCPYIMCQFNEFVNYYTNSRTKNIHDIFGAFYFY